MSLLRRRVARLKSMDFYDYLNHAHHVLARAKMAFWYSFFLGSTGRRSWMKRPSLIYGPGAIHLGDEVRIEAGAVLYSVRSAGGQSYKGVIQVGDRTFLNKDVNLTAAFGIRIGCDVAFGPNVFVTDFDHDYRTPGINRLHTPLMSKGEIVIGNGCWIGANVCVASGVELGEDCVVGANSVVTSSFPAGTVLAGNPATAIRRYDPATGHWLRVKPKADTMPLSSD